MSDLALQKTCALLARHGAKYVLVGAQAAILHGYVRNTSDVDLLVPEDIENHRRIIAALSELEDHAARELSPQDFVDNVVVKIADEVEIDVSTRAWKVSYEDAFPRARRLLLGQTEIVFADLETLIASKQTYREQDRVDLLHLRELLRREQGKSS